MKDQKLNIILNAENRYSGELSKAQRAFAVAGGAITASLKVGAVAAAAALGAISIAAYKAVSAANEVDAVEKQLATALGYTSQALLDQASALQKVTAFGDDQIVQAQAQIAAFVKDEEQIKKATKATLDLAAAKGMDLASAGDLVAKTLGSSTNALGRYGVEVKGAVGSSERLESVTRGIADVFGGQAAAQTETFGGKITQLKHVYGDLWEELGFVITRNTFFVKGLDVIKDALSGMVDKIKENRIWLMELAKSGVLTFVSALGGAVSVIKFFHNGWMGLKLVGQAVSLALVESINWIYKALRFVLLPLDLMYQGMVQLGLVKVNPFDAAQDAVNEYREVVLSVGADVLTEIEDTNAAYKVVQDTIKGIEKGLRNIQVAQADVAAGAPKTARAIGETDEDKKKREAAAKAAAAAKEAAQGKLGGLVDPTISAPEDVFAKAWLGYQAQLAALDQYNAQKLLLMQAAGFSEQELAAENARMVIDQEAKKRDFQLGAASEVFGGLSSMMQNLTVLTGKENGAAFKTMKAFAIAETTIQTYRAAQGSYAALSMIPIVGPALGTVAAASAIVAGLARVNQIASMQPGGSASGSTISSGGTANPSYSGGSTGAYPVPTRNEPRQSLNVTVNAYALDPSLVNWDEMMEKQIAPALERLSGDRDVALNIRVAAR